MDKYSFSPGFIRFVTFSFLLLHSLTVQYELNAQALSDTVNIKEVSIVSKDITRFQAGAKVETIPGEQLHNMQDGNLENLILRYTPIYLKGNAGGLSTIRFRGTSPDHTSVNFGGIDLNSLTLGHSNISNVPLFLFDEIELQFGGSSAVNGSGSIGGAIHLGLKNNWTEGFKAEMRMAHGSFGENIFGAKIFLGNGKWESVTRIFYYKKNNNFSFYNTSIKDFSTGQLGVDDIQKNAGIENKGILQELNYKFATLKFLKIKVWLEDDWHYIQQNQASNYLTPAKKETYEDKHARVWASYDNRKTAIKYHIGLGYVYDNGIYNQSPDPIKTQRFVSDTYIEHEVFKNGTYKVGAKILRIEPKVYAYDENLQHEDRIDLHLSYNHQLFKKLRATINLRQGYVTNFSLPFVPAFGISYNLIYNEKHLLKLNGNIAKSYRVPTFNHRYWVPGGNPNLLPEEGMNYEFGIDHNYFSEQMESSFKVNTFYINVDNWILWKNGGSFWYAENVQHVQSKGIEINGNLKIKRNNLEINNGFNYAYTNTERTKSLNENSAVGRQLEYVPLHRVVAYSSLGFAKFDFSIDGSYTHEQYTDETDAKILSPIFLLNAITSYQIIIKKTHKLRINAMINNILNTNYQSTYDYAMPGINYRISLTYNFN